MARLPSTSTVRSVLRKLSSGSSRPGVSSRYAAPSSFFSGRKSNSNSPAVVPSTRSYGPYLAAFLENLDPQHWGDLEKETHFRKFSTSGSGDLSVSSATKSRSNSIRLYECPEFRPLEQRWRHQSRYANSSFMVHPMILMPYRGFASGGGNKDETLGDVIPTSPPDGSKEDAGNIVHSAKDWAENAYNGILQSAKSVEEAVDAVTPPIKRILEVYPVILDISIPVGVFTGAWVILPRVLRRMHGYVEQGSAVLQQGQEKMQTVPYELSVWKAMEDPARLFATLLTLLQVGVLVTPPSAAVAQYLSQFWSGGSVLCVVWFLHRWKSNVLSRYLSGRKLTREERERYLGLDKFSSLGLIFIGALGLAEAAGVAVSSLLTVGGIGGIATAFSAREILANLLTGLTLSFSKPFTVGDTIKAGAVEGKVEEVGLTSTRLLNQEKNPIIVPNAFFTSQAIVNKSRAPWRALAVKIPIRLDDFEKVPAITLEIREMLYRNPQVFLDEDKPRCHILQFTPTALEIAIGCNVKPMSKNEYFLVEQEILVEAARIITSSGATLGGQ